MKTASPSQKKFLFFCHNERMDGKCCGKTGALLRDQLKAIVKARGLGKLIRVSKSGCLDLCAKGPSVLLMPDNVWFQEVTEEDLPAILERSLQTGIESGKID